MYKIINKINQINLTFRILKINQEFYDNCEITEKIQTNINLHKIGNFIY